ncbi:hypothetical protein NVP2275O_395 [Vibrio phage 2.275.O._10N.286.54.E11]|nr:hypothetical protein NVP2275O_395 [Vibrio phage 2.275.O._10N.286.54.E11]
MKNGWYTDGGLMIHYGNGVMSNFDGPARIFLKNPLNSQFYFNGKNCSKEVKELIINGTIELDDTGNFTEEAKVTIQLMFADIAPPTIHESIVDAIVLDMFDENNGIEW